MNPKCIFLYCEDHVKLTGFGETKSIYKKINMNNQYIKYLSPETNSVNEYTGELNYEKADIFSLGLCFLRANKLLPDDELKHLNLFSKGS